MKTFGNPNIIRLFVFLCFYAAISYGMIAWKYLVFLRLGKKSRLLMTFTHIFIVISNIIGFLVFVLIDKHAPLSMIASYAGLLLAILGVGLIIWAILKLGIATFAPSIKGQLITTGLYRITSHPMYLGGIIVAFGLALYSASMLAFVYALVIMLSLIIISKVEEIDLSRRFGTEYLNHKKRTLFGKIFSNITR